MKFTDEELESLKSALHWDDHDIPALIARLEAAEECLKYVRRVPCDELDEARFNAWERSKGEA